MELKYTKSSTSNEKIEILDRLKPMVKKSPEDLKTFYDPTVEKIVKNKLDKFTYGGEIEVGGVYPEEVENISSLQSKEKRIKALMKKGVVKTSESK